MDTFDIAVVGAGPAGYVAAIRAAQLGFKVACVDRYMDADGKARLGGTCLNVGCIPSKALLESSHHLHFLAHDAAAHGISTGEVTADVPTMIARKAEVVAKLTGGIEMLFKARKIAAIAADATLLDGKKLRCTPHEGDAFEITAEHIILAPGSKPMELPFAPFDHTHIIDSSDALALQAAPKRLGVIGAGVIGLELGSVWARLGSEVALIDMQKTLLPTTDGAIQRQAKKAFRNQGLQFHLGQKISAVRKVGEGDTATVEVDMADEAGNASTAEFDILLVAAGRVPATANIAECALDINDKGQIVVDADYRTNIAGVYAIGDAIHGAMLAHKGSEEGVVVAERIAGEKAHVNYDAIPWVIYTQPEIAWIGPTEEELKAQGVAYKAGSFLYAASGRALANGSAEGVCKWLVDANTDAVLALHLIGGQASELVALGVAAMEMEASIEDIQRTVFAHPTLSEVVHEAALAVDNRALHSAR